MHQQDTNLPYEGGGALPPGGGYCPATYILESSRRADVKLLTCNAATSINQSIEMFAVKWPIFRPKSSDLGAHGRYRPQEGEDMSGTETYHHVKFRANRCHRRRDICNRREKKLQPIILYTSILTWNVFDVFTLELFHYC